MYGKEKLYSLLKRANYRPKAITTICLLVIVERIKKTGSPFYRPTLPEEESEGVHPGILTLMKQCWAEEPAERPSFNEVAKTLKIINKGKLALTLCILAYSNSILTFLRIGFWYGLDFVLYWSYRAQAKYSIQIRWDELFQPTMQLDLNTISLVHVRAFTFVLAWVLAKWYLQFKSYDCRLYTEF